MTKEDFIKKYIYGIGNDALTDNQEAIDMAKDLDRYFTEQLRQYNVVGRSEQLVCGCGNPNLTWYGHDDDKTYFCFECKKEVKK